MSFAWVTLSRKLKVCKEFCTDLVGEGGLRGGEGGGGGDPHGGGIGESNCIIRSLTSRQCDRRHYDDDALCHPNHHRWFFESWWNPYIWPLSSLSDADAIEGPSLSVFRFQPAAPLSLKTPPASWNRAPQTIEGPRPTIALSHPPPH